MRILHFSDIHIATPWVEVPWRKWIGKRSLAFVNLLAGRARRFAEGRAKLAALERFRREQRVDLVLFTGDYTALGLEAELAAARAVVEPLMAAPLGFVNIPGNHDLYLHDALRGRWFERHFGDTLRSDLRVGSDGTWPLVRLVDPDVAVVALNGARPNPQPWRSSGRIPRPQLAALRELLRDGRLAGRCTFVLSHYPPLLADGSRDSLRHRLVNDDELLAACTGLGRGAILSGHVHHRYALRLPGGGWLFCSGSATLAGREGLWIFDVTSDTVRATPGAFQDGGYALDAGAAFDLAAG
jgi:3',5'-cyclic AMP phosphodiesterase CpdA